MPDTWWVPRAGLRSGSGRRVQGRCRGPACCYMRKNLAVNANDRRAPSSFVDAGHEKAPVRGLVESGGEGGIRTPERSEEHTSELQSLMRISYAVFCLKKKQT